MGSYDVFLKTREIRKVLKDGNYEKALKILETINLSKIKKIADFELAVKVFVENERYKEAYELLGQIYEKTESRKTLYELVSLAIKSENIEDAEIYLEEYEKQAPEDFYSYVFRYEIYKKQGKPLEILIETLETLKEKQYMEKWLYELAKLYYKAGMEEKCIKQCSDIILWFGEGKYVEKAKVLRAYYSGEADKETILKKLKERASSEEIVAETDNIGNNEEV